MRDVTYPPIIVTAKAAFRALGQRIVMTGTEHVPREDLAAQGSAANDRTIDVQINRLRRKIERDPADPLYLQTVRGIGYRLVTDRV